MNTKQLPNHISPVLWNNIGFASSTYNDMQQFAHTETPSGLEMSVNTLIKRG